jgi:hypothetical protein
MIQFYKPKHKAMNAKEAQQKTFNSVKEEISNIEKLIDEKANEGKLSLDIKTISNAAYLYFTQNNFNVSDYTYINSGFTIYWN